MGKTSSQQSMGDAVVLALHVVAEFSAELGALFLCEGKKFPVCHDDIIMVHDILNVAEIDDAAAVGHVELRRIQLRTGQVDTLCGNGRPGDPVEGPVAANARSPLNHPVGLAVAGNQVHIASAGDNRIWSCDLGRGERQLRAGTGRLEVTDGNAKVAAFAQPAGLAAVQQVLYV